MKLLLDTHVLLWASFAPKRLSKSTFALLDDRENSLFFSAASLWEIAIKSSLKRRSLTLDARALLAELLLHDYSEIPVTSAHALAVEGLPQNHKDPFDRILVAQALVEDMTLLTDDRNLLQYPGSIRSI